MGRLKKALINLLKLGFISENQDIESNYDLLNKILADKPNNKKKLEKLNKKRMELEAYLEIINDESLDGLYNSEELKQIYENIAL